MRYHNITTNDMLNGEGLRVVLWLAGCHHQCDGCHNPVTWDDQEALPFDLSAKKELLHELDHDHISGITLSGGDPLYPSSVEEVSALIKDIKKRFINKSIWLYTGYTFEEIQEYPLLQYVDVLVDGKFDLSLYDSSLHWRGSSNQRIIDIQKTLQQGKVILYK